MKIVFAFCFTLLWSHLAFSEEYVWKEGKISRIYPLYDGSVILNFSDDSPQCTNGAAAKHHYLRVGESGVTEKGFDLIFATALAASMGGKTVSVSFDKSSNSCHIRKLYISL